MKLFNIFKKQKKLTIKELYAQAPIIDEMWVCAFNFEPWEPEKHKVVFKKVKIVEAKATPDGIFVTADEKDPLYFSESYKLRGYIDKITSQWSWTGFFETKEDAEKAYNELMKKWISVIESKMVGAVDLKEVMK